MQPLPTVIIPGYFAGAQEYQPLAQSLSRQGIPARVVPLSQLSWLPTLGGKPVTPVLKIIAQTLREACREHNSAQVNLVGHSAGGWIARILMGEKVYDGNTWALHPRVRTLITLGTPHCSQEPYTRANMEFVNNNYPGAFQAGVRYVCLAGKAVLGTSNWLTRQSYLLTVGDADGWGDGITPISAAHLTGAENLVYEQVLHSPRGGRFWYGSPAIVAQWIDYLR